jgi:uncharacterized protein YacL
MSSELISRIIGMIIFSIGGLFLGVRLADLASASSYLYGTAFFLIGALAGLVLTPYLTIRPLRSIRQQLRRVPVQQLLAGTVGLVAGLIIAALLASPLSLLPPPFNQILPFLSALVFGYLGVVALGARLPDLLSMFRGVASRREGAQETKIPPVLLDTSVIIDGRIADISRTGFIIGEMLVPRFILNELQHVADSPEALRRNRGRRGLDMLHRLQEESVSPIRIIDTDVEGVRDADDKLVLLAKQLNSSIVTNDYNLNRVAEIQGVTVLNINELANAVKAILLPGETITIHVIQQGKEQNQGVGYLDDGTMVVVENGESYIDSEVRILVTKVLQTAAGRMVFARIANGSNSERS